MIHPIKKNVNGSYEKNIIFIGSIYLHLIGGECVNMCKNYPGFCKKARETGSHFNLI
jgi:hypothetical protein